MFCKETSKNVKNSKRKKMQEGFYACNTPPYGYKKNPDEQGKLIIDEESAKVVKMIFELKLRGLTQKEISEYLNKKNIKTPAQYLRVKGLSTDISQIWTRASIGKILSNRVYLGDCIRGKTQNISYKTKKRINVKRKDFIVVENTHEPIITREIYYKVHSNSKSWGITREMSKNIETKFGKYIYCYYCGKRIEKRNSRGKINLHCSSNRNSKELCDFSDNYFYEQIEPLIINHIQKSFEEYFKENTVKLRTLKKYNNLKLKELESKYKEQEMALRKTTFKISQLYNDRLNEEISEYDYKKQYEYLLEERKQYNNEKNDTEQEIEKFKDKNINIGKSNQVKKIIKSLTNESLTSEDIEKLITKIELGKCFIYIHYKFKDIDRQRLPTTLD